MRWSRAMFVPPLTFLLVITITPSSSQLLFPIEEFPSASMPVFPLQAAPANGSIADTRLSQAITQLIFSLVETKPEVRINSDAVIYSPVNIAGVIALLLMASNGRTYDEINKAFGFNLNSHQSQEQFGALFKRIASSTLNHGEEVNLAESIFVQEDFPIREAYKQIAERLYKCEIVNVDFKTSSNAKSVINNWVADKTHGKIPSLLFDDPPTNTKAVVVGVLYFKAAWEKTFFNGMTKKHPFYPDGRGNSQTAVMVDLMANGGLFPYYKDPTFDCEILGFPYVGNQTVMYVIMPTNSNRKTLLSLQQRLTPRDIDAMVDNTIYKKVVIGFPKMTIEASYDLTQPLMNMGIKSLFNPATANLALLSPGHNFPIPSSGFASRQPAMQNDDNSNTLIFSRSGLHNDTVKHKVRRQVNNIDALRASLSNQENPGLYVDQVLHKVFMEVTESGTEAAAATAATLARGGDITVFRVDQPFLFFIRHQDTKTILFWGAVNKPSPSYPGTG